MEKQSPPSDETVSFKEYPPSEIFTTSDPPPAYIKSRQSSIVQVARIAAYTLVAVSFILGSFILASSYVTATLSCQEYQPYPQELIEDRLPRFQGLIAEPLESDESRHNHLESADHRQDDQDKDQKTEESHVEEKSKEEPKDQDESSQESEEQDDQDEHELKFKLPIHLDLDALTGALLEGNSKNKMNCVIEKQKSEEVLNKDQRELITFGLDLAALDPGMKHVTGERLAIVCETSREAPKDNQLNHIVLPFPMPSLSQRMMPHPMPQQPMPQHPMPHHMMPQHMPHMLPRNPFPLPFMRPNPFQNFLPRPQSQSSKRNVEEIPIFVLEENDARLQNLIELPRSGHPQIQNLVELHRANPQIQQIQNIVELARGSPDLHNLVEIPEKAIPMIHPAVPEGRHLPPWSRPEVQEPVVQIQPVPHMMRPPQPRTIQVQVEARPFHVESSSMQVEGRPTIQMEHRPVQMGPRPIQLETLPIQVDPRPVQMEHRPVQMEHRPIQMEHRPIQMEPRPIQLEPRPDGRRPEGRALPIPSDTVNPPPLPFDMQPEPSRPHFVQPRSVRSIDSVLHRRDKRERRCACDCAC